MHDTYTLHELESGLTTILVPMPSVRSVTVLAMVGTGSRFETPSTNGISHFLEHMVFKGTTKYPTPRELASVIDAVGAEFNAFTSKEYTGYYVKAASEHLELALDVVSDMLLQPKLNQDDLEREKGVIVEEIHMYEDSPARHIGDVFERMMYEGSSLGRDVIGTEETVQSFQRQHFVSHLKHWYGLKNVVLVIAGDETKLNDKKTLSTVEAAFGKSHEERKDITTAHFLKLRGNPIQKGKRLAVHYKDTQQAHFVMAFPGMKRTDPDRYALGILSTLLGGNMSSRLFTEVREKRGLCYYVRSDEDFYHDTGSFGASAGVDPSRVDEAVKVIKEQLLLLTDSTGAHAITQEEVDKAKSHVLGGDALYFEDSGSVAQFYAVRRLLLNSMETITDKSTRIKKVTLEDVQRVAKRFINEDEISFAIIGPYKRKEKFAKLLK
jgi:predicted Zn-dependent peptidase